MKACGSGSTDEWPKLSLKSDDMMQNASVIVLPVWISKPILSDIDAHCRHSGTGPEVYVNNKNAAVGSDELRSETAR
ncbi:hypothetical protein RhiTH_001782 [Rhizoctonia solani]|uniref:Uncharacterized protein n=1 Tax=Rhizoctonia solani TaxID=456999 RepID=A0A8H7INF4_9AGAM|nr:hypothetical protein RHS01_00481 [Rhizoctonia solani]